MTTNGGAKLDALTPQQLFDQGDYHGAVDLLLKRVDVEPTDADRRLLAESLLKLDDPREITEALYYAQAIEEKDAVDYVLIGWCCIQLEDWDNASFALEQAQELGESAWTYYLLAVVYAEGRPRSEIDPETLDLIELHLRKAIAFPNCGLEAFLWLEKLQGTAPEGVRERIDILQTALQAHPDSATVRQRLAQSFIEELHEPEQGLRWLEPLLVAEDGGGYTNWLACTAWSSKGDNEKALEYLHRIPAGEGNLWRVLIESIFLNRLGRHREAATILEQAATFESQVFAIRALARLGLARAHLGAGQQDEAAQDVAQLAALCEERASDVLCEARGNGWGSWRISTQLDGVWVEFKGADFVFETCELLMSEMAEVLSQAGKGWLSYIQFCVRRAAGVQDIAPLLRAVEYVDHPAFNRDLITYYLVEAKDVVSAVRQHLASALRAYSAQNPETGFDPALAAFRYDDVEGQARPVTALDEKERAKIHHIGMASLCKCSDAGAVREVFIPFYRSFWRELLVEGAMYKELEQAADAILAAAPEARDEMFDYAFSLHKQGRLEHAEKAYRELLAADPEHVPTLHNLALTLRDQGALDEALALSNQAAGLAPEDELVTTLNQALREKHKERQAPMVVESVERREPGEPVEIEESGDGDDQTPAREVSKANGVVKPIFNSNREKRFYDVLIGAFPNYLVFPNMACSAIFDYERMKELLADADQFRHFLMAIVDFCVVSTIDYAPVVAFEIDSDYHDSPERIEKDSIKDQIFQLGGVPLIRWRPKGKQEDTDIKRDIISAVQQAQIGFEVNGGV